MTMASSASPVAADLSLKSAWQFKLTIDGNEFLDILPEALLENWQYASQRSGLETGSDGDKFLENLAENRRERLHKVVENAEM